MQIKKESSVNRQEATAFVLTFRFDDHATITFLIILKQQLLHSDWLRACEIDCETSLTECEKVTLKMIDNSYFELREKLNED